MRRLSKSKLIAFRQCPKRLWLELHKPELRDDSGSQTAFNIGHQLVNGSAAAYSKALLETATELTNRFPFPWIIKADGTQRITDHQRFYEQTFNTDLQGIETLKRWINIKNLRDQMK